MSLSRLLLLLFTANVITFGSGRVMVPILERSLVEDTHALGLDQFLYAFTIGRITPGPANLYVAGIAYMLFGPLGALLSVVVVCLPAYLIIPLHAGFRRLARNGAVRGFSRGLTAASVGLILASTVDIGRSALTSPAGGSPEWRAIAVCALTLAMLHVLRWNTLICLAAATAAGVALSRLLPA